MSRAAQAASRSGWRAPRWLQALRVTHPFPTSANALTAGGLGLIAVGRLQPNWAIARLMLAMLAMQACIGTVNDLADFPRDAVAARRKPLVEGALSVHAARVLALLLFAATVVLSAGNGWAAWLLAMAALSCGLVYDVKLSRTRLSVLPYLIALPLVPIWIWVALGRFRPLLLAACPLGALLGLSLHLANGLTDFDSDARTGSHGLAQCLGRKKAAGLCWGAFALALLLVAGSALSVRYRPAPLLAGLLAAALLLLCTVALALAHARAAAATGWGLLVAASAALALGWLAALPPH
jgi:4-hydroxybenzoate polyprenyltransferase